MMKKKERRENMDKDRKDSITPVQEQESNCKLGRK
jgi:hypothetical protein